MKYLPHSTKWILVVMAGLTACNDRNADANGYDQTTTNTEVNGQVYTLNTRIGEVSAAATGNNPASLTVQH